MKIKTIGSPCLIYIFLFFVSSTFNPNCFAQSSVTNLGDGIDLADIGLDPVANELVFVGSEVESGVDVAKVFRLSSDRTTLSSDTLVGLGPNTVATGISPDAVRISGHSDSPASIDQLGEGTTWLASSPEAPTGVGFSNGITRRSPASASWNGGVVGTDGGADNAYSWTPEGGMEILPDVSSLSTAFGVSADGGLIAGVSTQFGATNGAAFWDDSGINPLADPFGISGVANAVSPNAEFIGGDIDFFNPGTFETGSQATVWSGGNGAFGILNLLQIQDPDTLVLKPLLGQVNDVSNSGYAIGETADGRGFIWHESFDGAATDFFGAQIFDDWLFETEGLLLPSPSTSIVGIAEDADTGALHFAVNGPAVIVSDVQPFLLAPPLVLLGDVNLDGEVTFLDISPFIAILSTAGFQVEADIDLDAAVTFLDIAPLIAILADQ